MGGIYSMTGYSRSEGKVAGAAVTIEIKSVNHRYLDVKTHLPRELLMFEGPIMELARQSVGRGRLEIWVSLFAGDRPMEVGWNRALARGVLDAMKEMKDELGLAGEPELSLLASQKDVILVSESGAWGEESWPELAAIIKDCFTGLNRMRQKEGEALAEDVRSRVSVIEARAAEVSSLAPSLVDAQKHKLEKRLAELLEGRSMSEDRLVQEAAIMADRYDFTEELVRLSSHIGQFRAALEADGPKGRKLDFLVQEMFREINTAGNKAMDASVQAATVEMKTELEKVREQVQNLE